MLFKSWQVHQVNNIGCKSYIENNNKTTAHCFYIHIIKYNSAGKE